MFVVVVFSDGNPPKFLGRIRNKNRINPEILGFFADCGVQILAIFLKVCDQLKIDSVKKHHNFFFLGGVMFATFLTLKKFCL